VVQNLIIKAIIIKVVQNLIIKAIIIKVVQNLIIKAIIIKVAQKPKKAIIMKVEGHHNHPPKIRLTATTTSI
jgi:hypothetical protein